MLTTNRQRARTCRNRVQLFNESVMHPRVHATAYAAMWHVHELMGTAVLTKIAKAGYVLRDTLQRTRASS